MPQHKTLLSYFGSTLSSDDRKKWEVHGLRKNNILYKLEKKSTSSPSSTSSTPPSPAASPPQAPPQVQEKNTKIKQEKQEKQERDESEGGIDYHARANQKTGFINVYTDGSCLNNGKKNSTGGVGIYFGENDPRNLSCRITNNKITNQTMELLACRLAIERYVNMTEQRDPQSAPAQPLRICTDSEYVVKSMNNWAQGWERNGWKTSLNKPVSNLDYIRTLWKLKNKHRVQFMHVRAHRAPPSDKNSLQYAQWHGNDCADKFARNSNSPCVAL